MSFLLDYIIGPILSFLGLITIDEEGNWFRADKKGKSNYEKKERKDRKSLWERFEEKRTALMEKFVRERRKKSETTPKTMHQSISAAVRDILNASNFKERTRDISTKKLRSITKFEGKLLAGNEGYRIWYGDHFPYDDEVEEGVVYIVKGQGYQIAPNSPYFSGIREDAYYVWDKTNSDLLGLPEKKDDKTLEMALERARESVAKKLASINRETGEVMLKNKELKEDVKNLKDTLETIKEQNRTINDMARGTFKGNHTEGAFEVDDSGHINYILPPMY